MGKAFYISLIFLRKYREDSSKRIQILKTLNCVRTVSPQPRNPYVFDAFIAIRIDASAYIPNQ